MFSRRAAIWLTLLVGLVAISRSVLGAWPLENRIQLVLPRRGVVERIRIEISDSEGEVLRTTELHPDIPNPESVLYVAHLPRGKYHWCAEFEIRPSGALDKNHVGGWTRMGVRHQIRFEGEDYRFPPPEDEAQ
jgi:hypothetical protein